MVTLHDSPLTTAPPSYFGLMIKEKEMVPSPRPTLIQRSTTEGIKVEVRNKEIRTPPMSEDRDLLETHRSG